MSILRLSQTFHKTAVEQTALISIKRYAPHLLANASFGSLQEALMQRAEEERKRKENFQPLTEEESKEEFIKAQKLFEDLKAAKWIEMMEDHLKHMKNVGVQDKYVQQLENEFNLGGFTLPEEEMAS